MSYFDWLFDTDWLFVWKVTSIGVTGAFGCLALATKYKEQDGTITRWGKIALGGILLSSSGGIVAQWKESSRNEASAKAAREQTLSLVKQTQRSVEGMEHLLNAIDAPTVFARFTVPCASYEEFCKTVRAQGGDPSSMDSKVVWSQWPRAPGLPPEHAQLAVFVGLNRAARGSQAHPDWALIYRVRPLVTPSLDSFGASIMEWGVPLNSMIAGVHIQDTVKVAVHIASPARNLNYGQIQSYIDLKGGTIELRATPYSPGDKPIDKPGLEPDLLVLRFSNGRPLWYREDTGQWKRHGTGQTFEAKIVLPP